MGIVHHSNYLRFCEEARVEWCRLHNLISTVADDRVSGVFGLTVYETRVKHLAPATYGDALEIGVQVAISGARIVFQYKIKTQAKMICLAETTHCRIDENFKVKRLDPKIIETVRKAPWTETWL